MYSALKSNKNKKQINTDYIKLKIDNSLYAYCISSRIIISIIKKILCKCSRIIYIKNTSFAQIKERLNSLDDK